MKVKLGIPRGMFYYDYYPLWIEFFNNLGIEVIISPKSNSDLLNKGVRCCVDEACLPVKTYHGHVAYLKDKVDYIFIPKFISIYKKEYCCPKHLGLPDMIRHSIDGLPQIIDAEINLRKSDRGLKEFFINAGRYFTTSTNRINKAFNSAKEQFRIYAEAMMNQAIPIEDMGQFSKPFINKDNHKGTFHKKILLLGHCYNIYDQYINMNIASKLKIKNINIITAEMIEASLRRHYAAKLPKRMFWTHGQRLVGAAHYLIEQNMIDGIVYVSAFGCGLDSVLIDLVERKAIGHRMPFILLTIDELTGEAGFNTRIEAFLDMLDWRDANENNFSSLG